MIENPFALLTDIPKEYEDILSSGLQISQITTGRWKHSLGLFRKELIKTLNPNVLLVGQYITKIPLKEVKRSLLKLAVDSETLIVFFEYQFMVKHMFKINEDIPPFFRRDRFSCFKNLYKYLFHVVFCVRNQNWVNNFRKSAVLAEKKQQEDFISKPLFLFRKDISSYKISFSFSSFRQSLLFDILALHSRKQSFNFFFVPRFHRSVKKAFFKKKFSKKTGINIVLDNSIVIFKQIKSFIRKFTFTPNLKIIPVDPEPLNVQKISDNVTTFIFFPKLNILLKHSYHVQSSYDKVTLSKMKTYQIFDVEGNYDFSGLTKMRLTDVMLFDPSPYKIPEQTFKSLCTNNHLKVFVDDVYSDKVDRFSIPKYMKKYRSKFKCADTYFLIQYILTSSFIRFKTDPDMLKFRYTNMATLQQIVDNDFSLIIQAEYIRLNYKKKIKLMLLKLLKTKVKYFSLEDKYITDAMIDDIILFLDIKVKGL